MYSHLIRLTPGKAIEINVAGCHRELVNEKNEDTVSASVLVECKNNTQPVAFFVQRQQFTPLNDNRIHYGGFPSFSMDQETKFQEPLHKLLEMKDCHHYCQANEVATQFCTFERIGKKKFKARPLLIHSARLGPIPRQNPLAIAVDVPITDKGSRLLSPAPVR